MDAKYDVVIIGSGVIGVATAFELSKKGFQTLNVDKLSAAGAGSTINTCGNIRFHYSTWDGVAMAYESSFYWDNWKNYLETRDDRGLAKFRKCGTVLIKGEAFNAQRSIEFLKELGVPFEEWDIEQLKARMPHLSVYSYYPPKRPEDPMFWDEPTKTVEGAIFTPGSGYINDPQLSVHNLQRAAEAKGGKFLFNAEVSEIRRNEKRVLGITLQDGTKIDTPIAVNAAGPHSFVINRMAGVEDKMNIKTKALRHEVHIVAAPKEFPDYVNQGHHISDTDLAAYCRPEVGNKILIGSEDPNCDERVWVNPDVFYAGQGSQGRNNQITQSQFEAQVYRMAKRMTILPVTEKPKGVVDLYDVSDDWIPIYDKADLKGFYMAIGTSGNQYKNAPVVGKMMAEIIDASEKGHDHDKDPINIHCRYTGLTLNSGFYSRLRQINPESSFSVLG